MPDEKGVLDSADKGKLEQWLTSHSITCPQCGMQKWDIATQIVAPIPTDGKGSAVNEGKVFDTIQLTCLNCASITGLNARTVGIL